MQQPFLPNYQYEIYEDNLHFHEARETQKKGKETQKISALRIKKTVFVSSKVESSPTYNCYKQN